MHIFDIYISISVMSCFISIDDDDDRDDSSNDDLNQTVASCGLF